MLRPFPASTSNVPGFPAETPQRGQQANLSNTFTLGPTAVNEARINFTRLALTLNKPSAGLGEVADFGYKSGGLGILSTDPTLEGVPPNGLFGATGLSFGLPDGTTGQFNNSFQGLDNFSKIVGKHTMKFGGEFRYIQINERNTYAQNGYFEFYGNETGSDFADYLIGAPDLFIQSSRQFLDSRTKYAGVYGQDTYKIKPNVTLNYGLRWEVSQPFYDTQGKIQAFVPGLQSQVYPDAPRGWVFPGDPGIPKTLAPTDRNNFAPRVGLAYSPGFSDGFLGKVFGGPGKTSIRAAYGIYYTAIEDLTKWVMRPSDFSMSALPKSIWRNRTEIGDAATIRGSASRLRYRPRARRVSGPSSSRSPVLRAFRSTMSCPTPSTSISASKDKSKAP